MKTDKHVIETRRDDEHGLERPWVAFIDGQPLRNKAGRIRTFGTEKAARKAAEESTKK